MEQGEIPKRMVKDMLQIRRIAAALLCFILLFCCCFGAVAEKKGAGAPAAKAAKKELKITGSDIVAKGKKITLKANQAVTWKTSDEEIATVTKDGVVKGIKEGTVKITAVTKTKPKTRMTLKITVTRKAVKEITITAPYKKLDLEEKKTVQLSASASPKASAQVFKWTSSDKSIAKVNKKGKVTAVGEGKVKITAEAVDGSGKKATIKITVKNLTPEEKEKQQILRIESGVTRIKDGAYDGNQKLREVELPESVTEIGHKAFANTAIRYIYIPAGVTAIEDDAFAGSSNLACLTPAGSYAAGWCDAHGIKWHEPSYLTGLSPVSTALVKNGAKAKIKSGIQPVISKAKPKWKSSDEKIFTVDDKGNIFGNYPGQAVLTVSSPDGSITAKVKVTVQANYRAVLFSESTFDGGVIQRNRGDVRLMKNMLASVTGPDGGKYTVSSYDDLTADQVYDKISKLLVTPSRDGDVSMFFIASHGDYRSMTEQYAGRLWCRNRQTWLELPTLAKKLSKIKGKVIVLLESCGPGAALHDFSAKAAAASAEQEDAMDLSREIMSAFSSADPGLSVYQSKEVDTKKTGKTAGAPRSNASRFQTSKFVVLTAAAYREMSYMYGGDTKNLFPYWLVQGVGTSGSMPADANKDGKLTLNELYKYVYKKTAYKQTPQVYPKNSDYVLFLRK